VQERDDGRNVNSWHWEEKNKLNWSREFLAGSLEGLSHGPEGGLVATVVAVKSVTGEVRARRAAARHNAPLAERAAEQLEQTPLPRPARCLA
jgi:hypothetical protein